MESYIYDDAIVLCRGMDDGDEVPLGYVRDLQQDLSELGFSPGEIDGKFGGGTEKAVKRFQTAAKQGERRHEGERITTDETYAGEISGRVCPQTRAQISLWQEHEWTRAESIPEGPAPWRPDPADAVPEQALDYPFAPVTDAAQYWPVRTEVPGGRKVSFRDTEGRLHVNGARRFGARRQEGRRYHVGIDLYGTLGDLLIACEDGVIANYHFFYRSTWALYLQCDSGLVINYGEVLKNSWKEFGLEKGSKVKAGDPVARVGKMHQSSMCHFETYVEGTTKNMRCFPDDKPPGLLNPTQYLLHLAAKGK